jgi:hypothetical protein
MHADRIDCPCALIATETQRIVLMLLLGSGHSPWSQAELQREISGTKDDPIDITDALDALHGAGLIHVNGELVTPTRAARLMDELSL